MEERESGKKLKYLMPAAFIAMLVMLLLAVFNLKSSGQDGTDTTGTETETVSEDSGTAASDGSASSDSSGSTSIIKHYGVGVLFGVLFLIGLVLAIASKKKELNELAENIF